jgi:Glutaredoxin-like domain (DUF836)
VLYTKPGCHLCEELRAMLDETLAGTGVAVIEADITRDLGLFVRLRHDIPVLEINGEEVARHRLTPEALVAVLGAAGLGRSRLPPMRQA